MMARVTVDATSADKGNDNDRGHEVVGTVCNRSVLYVQVGFGCSTEIYSSSLFVLAKPSYG